MVKRAFAISVLCGALGGCSVWVPVQAIGPESTLRVHLANDSSADLHDARVVGDSVAGMVYTRDGLTRRAAYPLGDVRAASARRLSPGRTRGAVVAGVAVAALITYVFVILPQKCCVSY